MKLIFLMFCFAVAGAAEKKATERVVFRTIAGDLVLSLYLDAAPKTVAQFLKLVRAGAYDTTHFYRVEPGFVIQLATAQDRLVPLSAEQSQLLQKLPAEFNETLKHRRGVLSMAREDADPNSGESSFSILLADAPHLDGKYTIFGEVERGFEVLDEFLRVTRLEPNRPSVRLTVNRAEVVETEKAMSRLVLTGPLAISEPPQISENQTSEFKKGTVASLVIVSLMLVLSLWFAKKGDLRRSRALTLLGLLVLVFLLYALAVPLMQSTIGAALLFFAITGIFKLMSGFENRVPT